VPLALVILALPIVEIAVFVLVGGRIGVLPTIGLTLLASFAGAVLLRIQGFGAVQRIQEAIRTKQDPSRDMAHGAMIMLAGLLLLIPGFVTDVFGLLLFVPFVRDGAWRFLRSRITVVTNFNFGFPGRGGGHTIDLDADDYSRQADPDRPPRIPRGD
jgi:UPF0716 protein FxsA